MVPLLLVLLLALILFGAGFALKALWWIAVIVLVVWLVGFFVRPASQRRQARPVVSLVDGLDQHLCGWLRTSWS